MTDILLALCSPRWLDEGQEAEGTEGDYRRLVNEIMRLMLADELKQLSTFTLESVITEVQRWADCGRSCFTDQATAAELSRPPPDAEQRSLPDRIILDVDAPQTA